MIYFIAFGLGLVTSIYWFIAGALYMQLYEDIIAIENKWERSVAFYLSVLFWPVGSLAGLWCKRYLQFSPQSWRDWALIPWWYLRYAFAWCWTQVYYPAWHLNCWLEKWGWDRRWLPGPIGRWVNPDPVMCPRCLWAGPTRWLCHTYAMCDEEDVEPVDECPRCGHEL